MKTITHSVLFSPGGCLTAQAFRGYLNSSLSSTELIKVKEHLRYCRICSEAMEGYKRHSNNGFLQGDLDLLSTKIRNRYASRIAPNVKFPVMIVTVLLVFFIILITVYYIIRYLLLNP